MELAIAEDVWPGVMSRLHAQVGTETYEAWFARLRLDTIEGATAKLSVPSLFLKRWIDNRYSDLVLGCLKAEVPYIRRLTLRERTVVLRYDNERPIALLGPPSATPRQPPAKLPVELLPETLMAAAVPEVVAEKPVASRSFRVRSIQRWICERFDLDREAMLTRLRTRRVCIPRQIAMYICKEFFALSLPEIGRRFGGRDHTTCLHAHRRITLLLAVDHYYAAIVDDCLFDLGIVRQGA